jgi:hypothetical protein
MKPATAKSAKEVKAAKESKAFDFTAPPAVTKQASKPFNGVFTGGVTAKQPFVPKADPLPVYVNPVKSVFSTAVSKKQVSVSIYLLRLVLINFWGAAQAQVRPASVAVKGHAQHQSWPQGGHSAREGSSGARRRRQPREEPGKAREIPHQEGRHHARHSRSPIVISAQNPKPVSCFHDVLAGDRAGKAAAAAKEATKARLEANRCPRAPRAPC